MSWFTPAEILLVLWPFVGAVAVVVAGLLQGPAGGHTPRTVGLTFTILGLVTSLGTFATGALDDAVAAPLVPLMALLATAVFLASPRSYLDRAAKVAVLLTWGSTVGFLLAGDLVVLVVFWWTSLLPGLWWLWRAAREEVRLLLLRSYGLLLVGTGLPLAFGTAVIGAAGVAAGLTHPTDLATLAHTELSTGVQTVVLVCFMVPVLIRMAILPFHSWLPVFLEEGPMGLGVLLVGMQTGLVLALRVVLPLLGPETVWMLGGLTSLGLVTALYGSLVALVQQNLLRVLGFLSIGQAGFVVVGLASANEASINGALLENAGAALALSGLLLLVRGLQARLGTVDLRHLGGLASQTPRLTVLFFILGACMVGVPGSLAFVGEDLLVHGLLASHPLPATLLLTTTAMNAINFFRVLTTGFLGRPRAPSREMGAVEIDDLQPREWWTVALLAGVLVLGGLYPQPLLDLRAATVQELLRGIQGPGGGGMEIHAPHPGEGGP